MLLWLKGVFSKGLGHGGFLPEALGLLRATGPAQAGRRIKPGKRNSRNGPSTRHLDCLSIAAEAML